MSSLRHCSCVSLERFHFGSQAHQMYAMSFVHNLKILMTTGKKAGISSMSFNQQPQVFTWASDACSQPDSLLNPTHSATSYSNFQETQGQHNHRLVFYIDKVRLKSEITTFTREVPNYLEPVTVELNMYKQELLNVSVRERPKVEINMKRFVIKTIIGVVYDNIFVESAGHKVFCRYLRVFNLQVNS